MTAGGCPNCEAPLTGSEVCDNCELPLVGPVASRLWQVDQRLTRLSDERATLQVEREMLLNQLRTGQTPYFHGAPPVVATAPAPSDIFAAQQTQPLRTAPRSQPQPPWQPQSQLPPGRESNPAQVQNTLLGLGALLLALAGIVFAAVTYNKLGVVGRAMVLLTLTAVATAAPFALVRRKLTSSAEAIGAVALALAVVDAWSLRQAGVGEGTDARSYAAVAAAVLALATGAAASALPLQVWRISTVLLAQLPVLILLARLEASSAEIGVILSLLAAADLVILGFPQLPRSVRTSAALCGLVALGAALLCSIDALQASDRGGALGLVGVALVLIAGATRAPSEDLRAVLSGLAVPVLAGAAWGAAGDELTEAQRPLILVAVALVTLQGTGLLPRAHRIGPALGALAVVGAALATQLTAVLFAFGGPFSWVTKPWELTADSARKAVSISDPWNGTVITLAVLVAATVSVLALGLLLGHWDKVLTVAALLLVLSALVLPLGLATSYAVALGVLLVVAVAACGLGLVLGGQWRVPLLASGFVTALLAGVWSVADETATLAVLPIVAALAVALALIEPALLGVGALLLGAELAAVGASAGLADERVGGLLLIAPAICIAVSYGLRSTYRVAVEVAAAILAGIAVVLTTNDAEWLTTGLAVAGLLALAIAVRPDRRPVGIVAALLLAGSSWVRLVESNIEAPEPYVVPLGLLALALGWERRRRDRTIGSFTAYGTGLTMILIPSLVKSYADQSATRGLILLLVCVGVLLGGAQLRMRAPLVVGGAVLVADALNLMGPYARALPRWTLLAVAGAVLLGVGGTYEARRRDVARLKMSYEKLA